MTRPYRCHNRPPFRDTVLVQAGWVYPIGNSGSPTREALMQVIPDPMSKTCQHTLDAPKDPRCAGCGWQKDAQ